MMSSNAGPRVFARDDRTLEVRIGRPTPRAGSVDEHDLSVYFFFSRGFSLSTSTWSNDAFYSDRVNFLRFSAGSSRLSTLMRHTDPLNPIALFEKQMERWLSIDAPSTGKLNALAHMIGAELTDAVEQEAGELQGSLGQLSGPTDVEAFSRRVKRLCHEASGALKAVRYLRRRSHPYVAALPRGTVDSLAFAEEYACMVVDAELASLGRAIEKADVLRDGRGTSTVLRLVIARAVRRIDERRTDQGFAVPWGKSAEYFAYRRGLLKKELQRSLYIDTHRGAADPFVRNSAAMVAAGLAATWATLAQLPLWRGGWTTQEGVLFLGAAVGAYILKDRIKEWTRGILTRRLLPWDHDRRFIADALDEVGLGRFRGRVLERFSFLSSDEVPDDIRHLRAERRTVEGVSTGLDRIACYQRTTRYEADRNAPVPVGFGVTELLRVSLDDLLRKLDAPSADVRYFDQKTGRFRRRRLPKTYHLNLIISSQTAGQSESVTRHRVVVNRDGIMRIDRVRRRSRAAAAAATS